MHLPDLIKGLPFTRRAASSSLRRVRSSGFRQAGSPSTSVTPVNVKESSVVPAWRFHEVSFTVTKVVPE